MMKYTSTPIKVLGFFLLISIFFSCTKDSDLLADYVIQDSIEVSQQVSDQSEEDSSQDSQLPADPPTNDSNNENRDFGELKAFPSAQGGASDITGGRGGTVIHVTNLNDSGAGSLRAALTSTVTRIIVFDVSGTIVLSSGISLGSSNSNFTVAGQTAPEGGITIRGYPIDFTFCDNMIWRYVRIRNARYTGESDGLENNGFWSNGVKGLMIDHCSFSFNDDQAISLNNKNSTVENITVQRSLFGENATNIIVGHSMNYPSDNLSFIANLYSNSPHRNPNIGSAGRVDIINQVHWNYSFRNVNFNALGGSNDAKVNYIGNWLEKGANSGSIENLRQNGNPSIYTAYNFHSTLYTSPKIDDRNIWRDRGISTSNPPLLGSGNFTTSQHTLLPNTYSPMSPFDAYTSVLSNVGANRYLDNDGSPKEYIDSYDAQRINDVINKTSRNAYNKSWTLPTLPTNTRPGSFDSDYDGMADAWEISTFGDLTQTATEDENSDGYTNIEEYINQVDY